MIFDLARNALCASLFCSRRLSRREAGQACSSSSNSSRTLSLMSNVTVEHVALRVCFPRPAVGAAKMLSDWLRIRLRCLGKASTEQLDAGEMDRRGEPGYSGW